MLLYIKLANVPLLVEKMATWKVLVFLILKQLIGQLIYFILKNLLRQVMGLCPQAAFSQMLQE